jgi:hypothetical protein
LLSPEKLADIVYVPSTVLASGVNVAVQVTLSLLGLPQLVAPSVPPGAFVEMLTSLAVGGFPLPVHDNTAVIVTCASWP